MEFDKMDGWERRAVLIEREKTAQAKLAADGAAAKLAAETAIEAAKADRLRAEAELARAVAEARERTASLDQAAHDLAEQAKERADERAIVRASADHGANLRRAALAYRSLNTAIITTGIVALVSLLRCGGA